MPTVATCCCMVAHEPSKLAIPPELKGDPNTIRIVFSRRSYRYMARLSTLNESQNIAAHAHHKKCFFHGEVKTFAGFLVDFPTNLHDIHRAQHVCTYCATKKRPRRRLSGPSTSWHNWGLRAAATQLVPHIVQMNQKRHWQTASIKICWLRSQKLMR